MASSPGEMLKLYVHAYVNENRLPLKLKEEIPRKWEKYGDFVLFDARYFHDEIWLQQGDKFWEGVCEILKCKRLALKSKIQSDGYRTPNVKLLVGEDPWTLYVDNSVTYSWNVEKCMFSAGNASERHRVAKMNCRNEVVVDMFAGIGYFVLPFLIHAKADMVHACEWNPHAVVALKRNLKLNNVEDRCVVHEGDNCRVCPKGVADRVNLGLIPTSEGSWRAACEALKPSGGVLHVHGNVDTLNANAACEECEALTENVGGDCGVALRSDDRRSLVCGEWSANWKRRQWLLWAVHVVHSLMSIVCDLDPAKGWVCSVEDVHSIKSYAPHVDHLVLDVLLRAV